MRREVWLSVLILAGATLYRPITLWSANAWDLHAPEEILATGVLELVIGLGLMWSFSRFVTLRPLSFALLLGGSLFIAFNWHDIGPSPALLLMTVTVVALTLDRLGSARTLEGVALILIVALLAAPTVQVVWAHIDGRAPYPLHRTRAADSAQPTGNIEDVLVLVVDSYPMPAVARTWFEHDTTRLAGVLHEYGFRRPSISWSQNTLSSLAIPSILELRQVVEETPTAEWGNRKSRYEISRGDSFVASSFRLAGYAYTHLESGWNGATCGTVDHCVRGPWYDDAQSVLLSSSVFGNLLNRALGRPEVATSLWVFDRLKELEVFGDGERDFIFAHSMLPHDPYVVDSACSVGTRVPQALPRTVRIREQLACVDDLLIDLVSSIPRSTAVLIVGDHGSRTSRQAAEESARWTDSHIAERLGALVAYRIPSTCDRPTTNTNVSAMRAITTCALDVEIPSQRGGLVVGEEPALEISPTRIASIEDKIHDRTLRRQ